MSNCAYFYVVTLQWFQVSSLSKIDIIIENQQEMLILLKHLVSASQIGSCDEMEDFFPHRIDSLESLQEFNARLNDDVDFKKKMISILAIK